MYNTYDIEEAIICVKSIVENNLCGICGNTAGARVRFACGHVLCNVCLVNTNHCLLCLTPPDTTGLSYTVDIPHTQRAQNATKLLQTFQNAFKVDVSQRRKLSDQLKKEKEVFPSCIQAPMKYFNKRKSVSTLNKENKGPTFFPGQQISHIKVLKMERSSAYVANWLENNETKFLTNLKRKPFTDLSTNLRIPRRTDKIMKKVKNNSSKKKEKKKTAFKKSSRSIVESQSLLDQYLKPVEKSYELKRITKDFEHHENTNLSAAKMKSDKDESGIVIDEEFIVIDDSQTANVDKDKLAWLAVLEADKRDPFASSQTLMKKTKDIWHTDSIKNIEQTEILKVPFYKKSYLTEACELCDGIKLKHNSTTQSKEVSITIENDRFTTRIKMSTVEKKPNFYSRHTQTEINSVTNTLSSKQETGPSQDLFTADPRNTVENKAGNMLKEIVKNPNESSLLVIGDSDSDDAANESSIIQVTADVHQSSDQVEYGVLAELDQSDIRERAKRSCRGITPNSTESSDKENFDPNKAKRVKLNKKSIKKRKFFDNFEIDSIFS